MSDIYKTINFDVIKVLLEKIGEIIKAKDFSAPLLNYGAVYLVEFRSSK
jgi:hypothetical protein